MTPECFLIHTAVGTACQSLSLPHSLNMFLEHIMYDSVKGETEG